MQAMQQPVQAGGGSSFESLILEERLRAAEERARYAEERIARAAEERARYAEERTLRAAEERARLAEEQLQKFTCFNRGFKVKPPAEFPRAAVIYRHIYFSVYAS